MLVFGCESVGLPDDMLAKYAANTVSIPMRDPELRSLNLSTTVAVAAYEVWRRRGERGSRSSGPDPLTLALSPADGGEGK